MSEHDLLESVTRARDRLTALCARLETESIASGSPEIVRSLHDVRDVFDTLQSRYTLVRDVLDRSSDAVFAKHRDGRYAMINPLGAQMVGKSVDEVLGADDRSIFNHDDAERIMAIDRQVMNTGEPCIREETCSFDGVRTTRLTTTTVWYDEQRSVRGVIGIAQVVPDSRVRLEAANHGKRMRSMATQIVINEENLRRSLAAELHNGLGQNIALAKIKLSSLRSAASDDLREALNAIVHLVDQADRSLRSITFQISPPSLHDLGLVAALEWLAEDIEAKHRIRVHIEADGSPRIADEHVRVILFRAVRELLINAAIHSNASEATVRVARREDLVLVTVTDAGRGFDATKIDGRGSGLLGIREQLAHVHGTIQVESVRGVGTTVTMTASAIQPTARSTTDCPSP